MGWAVCRFIPSPLYAHTHTQLLILSPPPLTLISLSLSLSLSLSSLGRRPGLLLGDQVWEFFTPKKRWGGWDTIFCLIVHIVAAFQTDTLSWHVYLFVLRTQKLHLSWGTVGAMTAFAVQLAGLPARQLKLYAPRESKCHCRPSGSAPTTLDLSCHLFSLLSILWLDRHKG